MDENMSSSSASSKNTSWYASEIQSMLHSFGDCSKPMLETCLLIEEIVYDQMVSLMLDAAQIANSRGSSLLGLEDILFLMRKDKVKLARLLRYLSVKDMKATVLRGAFAEDEEAAPEVGITPDSSFQALETKAQQTKRIKQCYDFLSSIDQTGDLLTVFDEDFFDEIKHLRNLRLERMTAGMTESEYLKYFEARKVSFAKGKPGKFREWLQKDGLVDLKPNAFALEVLQYLAYETVAQIVDLAFIVRQDAQREKLDPVSTFMSSNMKNPDYPLFRPESDDSSLSPALIETLFNTESRCEPESSPKAKRPKTETDRWNHKVACSSCITPDEVREALRRYWSPRGPFTLLEKCNVQAKLLCL